MLLGQEVAKVGIADTYTRCHATRVDLRNLDWRQPQRTCHRVDDAHADVDVLAASCTEAESPELGHKLDRSTTIAATFAVLLSNLGDLYYKASYYRIRKTISVNEETIAAKPLANFVYSFLATAFPTWASSPPYQTSQSDP
jgi:hypothetical protein